MTKRTLLITYDLIAPGRDYDPVYDYIKSFDGWCHLLESVWLVRGYESASEVRDHLNDLTDRNDKVAVIDVTGDAWATTFSNKQTTWLKGHMRVGLAA